MTYLCVRVADLAEPSQPETTVVRGCSRCGEEVWSEASSRALARMLSGTGRVEHVCTHCSDASLTELIDARLIASGSDPECVRWVCPEHRRHCTRLEEPHEEHACVFD